MDASRENNPTLTTYFGNLKNLCWKEKSNFTAIQSVRKIFILPSEWEYFPRNTRLLY